ncbi:MAG: spore coat protein [Clostridiales bacterium]|nr:spore coat protein [Clostridiales bacterium]
MQFTQKETGLLKELKEQEKVCAEKYSKHSAAAIDAQLKTLFNRFAEVERGHLDTLTKIEGGTVPQPGGQKQPTATFSAFYGAAENSDKSADCFLCSDLLASEKHASSLYDSCIFEFRDENVRNALNHIQKEEQEHGKQIYDYMSVNNMYG